MRSPWEASVPVHFVQVLYRYLGYLLLLACVVLALVVAPVSAAETAGDRPRATVVFAFHPN
jgi:predicted membrane-bound mannosyltransferase